MCKSYDSNNIKVEPRKLRPEKYEEKEKGLVLPLSYHIRLIERSYHIRLIERITQPL